MVSDYDFFLQSPWALQQHLLLYLWYYCNQLLYYLIQHIAYSPPPPLFASSFVACRCCPLPIIRRMLLKQNPLSTLVACRRRHHLLSSHRPSPRHLARSIGHRHRCNPVLILTALVAPSASNLAHSQHIFRPPPPLSSPPQRHFDRCHCVFLRPLL